MKILHVDQNHPALIEGFEALGHENIIAYKTPLTDLTSALAIAEGIVIRSRFPITAAVLERCPKLKFIARLGAGLENIDTATAEKKNIALLAAPEGNRNAVGEHSIGLLLALLRKIPAGDQSVKQGEWLREAHRGWELSGRTVGIIGYGHMGKQLAKKLKGFDVKVLCYDILPDVGDAHAQQVPLTVLQQQAEVISLHTPQTPQTIGMINTQFIAAMHHPFWLINTARGSAVDTSALLEGIATNKILGAGLDVLEFESKAFTEVVQQNKTATLDALLKNDKVILSPHIGGWTYESHLRLATVILNKFKAQFHS